MCMILPSYRPCLCTNGGRINICFDPDSPAAAAKEHLAT